MNDGPPESPVDPGYVPHGEWRVTVSEVGDIRRRVRDSARQAGLDTDGADRFTVAVNEVVINAIQHGGGVADVSIGPGSAVSGVLVTVADRGPGFESARPPRLPPPDQEHGRGLWLVHHLCDDVTVDRGPDGTRISLRAFSSGGGP